MNGHTEVQIEGDPHAATFDAQVTGFILTKMMDMLDLNTIEEVYEYLNNTPFVCNMPKHKGVLWKDVIDDDPDYVEWLLDNRKLRSEEDHKKLEELFNEW